MRPSMIFSIAAIGILGALSAVAQDMGPDPANETITETETAVETATVEQRSETRPDRRLGDVVQNELRSDPLFQDSRVNVDIYKGLVLVHGAAPTREMVSAISEKLRQMKGVTVVFNYMNHPEMTNGVGQESIAVSYDSFQHLQDAGSLNASFLAAQRVRDRLAADRQLGTLDLDVDSYQGLIILHGVVPDATLATRAREIAAHTVGVDAVMSYVTVSPSVSAIMSMAPTPIRVPAAPVERRAVVSEISTPRIFEVDFQLGCPPQ